MEGAWFEEEKSACSKRAIPALLSCMFGKDSIGGTAQLHRQVSGRDNRAPGPIWSHAIPAPLSLRIKESGTWPSGPRG